MSHSNPSLSFYYPCFIPFHLADPAGILFFGHAFTLFHQAFEHFVIEKLECPWDLWFQNPEWIVPIKRAEAEYGSPASWSRMSNRNFGGICFNFFIHFNHLIPSTTKLLHGQNHPRLLRSFK